MLFLIVVVIFVAARFQLATDIKTTMDQSSAKEFFELVTLTFTFVTLYVTLTFTFC